MADIAAGNSSRSSRVIVTTQPMPHFNDPPEPFVRLQDLIAGPSKSSEALKMPRTSTDVQPMVSSSWADLPNQDFNDEGEDDADTENASEVHDILFSSIGFERVQDCLHLLQDQGGEPCTPGLSIPDNTENTTEHTLAPGFQDKLIEMFFRYDHPLCPALNEAEFMTWYQSRYFQAQQSLSNKLLVAAINFAAFSHSTAETLRMSPFQSLLEGRRALYLTARTQYVKLEAMEPGAPALVQAALLLSHWRPYGSSREVYIWWVTKAFQHAEMAKLSECLTPSRMRVLWWCCFVRDRISSLGCRNLGRLNTSSPGGYPTFADFGQEALQPHFVSKETKAHMIHAFIKLCQLTRITFKAMRLKRTSSCVGWSSTESAKDEQHVGAISTLDQQLMTWRTEFNNMFGRLQVSKFGSETIGLLHSIRIIHLMTVSVLYEQFLSPDLIRSPSEWMLHSLAMEKIKDAGSSIASICGSLLQHMRPEELPLTLSVWIILPIVINLTQISAEKGYRDNTRVTQLGHLMRVLHYTSQRSEGSQLMMKAANIIIAMLNSANRMPTLEWAGAPVPPVGGKYLQIFEDEVWLKAIEIFRNSLADDVPLSIPL